MEPKPTYTSVSEAGRRHRSLHSYWRYASNVVGAVDVDRLRLQHILEATRPVHTLLNTDAWSLSDH